MDEVKTKPLHDLLVRLLEAQELRRSSAAREFAEGLYNENDEAYRALAQILVEYAVTNIREAAQKRGLVELERGSTMVLDTIRLVMVSGIPASMRNEPDPRCYSSSLLRFVRDLVVCSPVAGVELLTAAFGYTRERAEQLENHEVVAKLDEITRLFEIKEKAGSDPASWRVQ